jgi:tricorn protease
LRPRHCSLHWPRLPLRRRSSSGSLISAATASCSRTRATCGLFPPPGGTATRLTAHPGLELFARFSPDGRQIAFTGQYDGDEQVYVIPSGGGEPRQLTWYPARGPQAERWGYDNQVYGWSPDGQRILFRSWRDSWTLPAARLYTVPAAGGPATPLPMPVAGSGAFSPDGRSIVYSPIFRDFRNEKRYAGGQANRLVIFDLAANTARNIPAKAHAQRDAMWIGSTIYYNSDEDGTFNLYAYDPATGQARQVTRSTKWDVRWPSADPSTGRIVYEMGGTLHVLDTRTGQSTGVDIYVPNDGLASRPSRLAVGSQVAGFALSPKGERALFVARGDIFTAPVEHGPTRNLTNSSSSHDKHARWSPDGSRIVFISDRTGEEELWLVSQDGSGRPEQLTRGGSAMRYAPAWSPDGSRIAFSDKDGKLYILTMSDRRVSRSPMIPAASSRTTRGRPGATTWPSAWRTPAAFAQSTSGARVTIGCAR